MEQASQSAPVAAPTPAHHRYRRVIPWLVVVGLMLLYALRWLADHWWVAACGTAWSLHAGALLLLAAMIRIHRAPLAGLAALALFALIAYQRGAAIPALGPAPSGAGLRITVANQGYWNDDPGVAPALLAADPDVVVLIETSRATEQALQQARPWAGEARNHTERHPFGWACFAKWPLRVEPLPDCPTGLAVALILERDSQPLRLIVIHPPPPMGAQQHATHRRILDRVAAVLADGGPPTIVLGDANATPEIPALRRLAAAGGLHRATPAYAGSWPALVGPAGMAIDHVLAGPEWRLVNSDSISIPGSDHRGRTVVLAPR
jgi:endonuclease/exonuclease/phosphatase (EEP) superfamily protein YafD